MEEKGGEKSRGGVEGGRMNEQGCGEREDETRREEVEECDKTERQERQRSRGRGGAGTLNVGEK